VGLARDKGAKATREVPKVEPSAVVWSAPGLGLGEKGPGEKAPQEPIPLERAEPEKAPARPATPETIILPVPVVVPAQAATAPPPRAARRPGSRGGPPTPAGSRETGPGGKALLRPGQRRENAGLAVGDLEGRPAADRQPRCRPAEQGGSSEVAGQAGRQKSLL